MDNKLVYDRLNYDLLTDLSYEHRKVLEWVGKSKKVLEIACHTGYISKWLKREKCVVHGIELYQPALEKASKYLDKAILGNIEDDTTWDEISAEKYDIVLLMHILEHLVAPNEILKRVQGVLKENSIVIVCLPNICNFFDRLKITFGEFEYTEVGVMDKTHLRFYSFHSAKEMLVNCGYSIQEYDGNSMKVKFRILPNIKGFRRFNNMINHLIYKILSPNITDKVLMFKCISADK